MAISKLVWTNGKRIRRGQKCKGHYFYKGGKRRFRLVDKKKKVQHLFDSPEMAKSEGWKPA